MKRMHRMRVMCLALILEVIVCSVPPFARARIIDANINGNWSSAATWVPAIVPGLNDTVRINTTVTVDAIGVCKRLEVGMSGGRYSADGTLLFSNSLAILSPGDIVLGDPPSSGSFSGYLTMSGGSLLITGDATLNAGAISCTGGTVTYDGTFQNVCPGSYFNLKFIGNVKTATGDIDVAGDLTISTATTFKAGGFTHTISGNWLNQGSLDGGNSTIRLIGTTTQTIDGTASFNNLILTNGPKVALGALAIVGDLTIGSAASLDAGSFIHIIDGNWTCRGTFNAGTGGINLAGSSSQAINGSTVFHNLAMYNGGTKTAANNITVEGTLAIYSGTTFNTGTSLHELKSSISLEGVLNGDSGTVVFNGSQFQMIYGPGLARFGTVRVNNSAGARFVVPMVTVDTALGLIDGKIYIGNTLLLVGNAAINGAGPNSFIITDSAGALVRTVPAGSTVQFPIGLSDGSYNPVSVGLAVGDPPEVFAANVSPLSSAVFGFGTLDTTRSVKCAWYIHETTPGGNLADLTFRWNFDQDGSNIGLNPNQPIQLSAMMYNAGSKSYQPIADVNGTAGASDPLISSTTGHPASTFGFTPFVLGVPTPLLISLTSFTGEIVAGIGIGLKWTTASEIGNYGFYVQRKLQSDVAWTELPESFTAGNGTTTIPHSYVFVDSTAGPGVWMYRLRQVDTNGTSHLSNAITISVATAAAETPRPLRFSLGQNYPNPFNPTTTIDYTVRGFRNQASGVRGVKLSVFDILGREVAVLVNQPQLPGRYSIRWDASAFSSGTYIYRLEAGDFVATRAMQLIK